MARNELHRTNINLYAADVDYLSRRFGFGWSEQVREAVNDYVLTLRAADALMNPENDKPIDLNQFYNTDGDGLD